MSIALTEDHRALAEVARSFLAERGAIAAARELLTADHDALPAYWAEISEMGWPGLHLPEALGGSGYGLGELIVVAEELARVAASGPFLATTWASAVIDAAGTPAQRERYLPGLAAGTTIGAVGLGGSLQRGHDGRLSGDAGLVLSGELAQLLVLRAGDDLVIVEAEGLPAIPTEGLDPVRRVARVDVGNVVVPDHDVIAGGAAVAVAAGRLLAAAEAAGGAAACLETAVEYAKVREQFGRTIGSFQAVKHHCANMLVDAELSAAVAWDAGRAGVVGEQAALTAALAATQALPAYRRCAEKNIQILGGIGYTWEHDAHLHLRRASVLAAVFGGDRQAPLDVAGLMGSGVAANGGLELPPEAEQYRADARAFRATYDVLPEDERRAALIDSGYFMPHWPKPFGRAAGAIEQIVIDEELEGVDVPNLGIGTWVLLTLVQHGTPDQIERWVRPSLLGELRWCQLFSEPNAGSDAAAISTRATRVDGGWLVNGQKVWTSDAHNSNRGLATVRTDTTAGKHAGVSTFAIDMKAKGVEVRPLTELTGENMFNEVFFDDVFVPDDDVVGEVNQGWKVARATLGNERVSIGGSKGNLDKVTADDLVALAAQYLPGDTSAQVDVGRMAAEEHAMSALNLRQVMRSIIGGPPGAEGNITKLLSAEHAQSSSALGMRIVGEAGIAAGEPRVSHAYQFSRCLTIAGGTSEIVRNVIAERLLGLPRDPLAK
ncbi:MAG: acyl-CoA dehydrogenase [Actinomycetota bacterium]|nr:acyl-CoA dehydrogenase [Actinomycetota bacterium]